MLEYLLVFLSSVQSIQHARFGFDNRMRRGAPSSDNVCNDEHGLQHLSSTPYQDLICCCVVSGIHRFRYNTPLVIAFSIKHTVISGVTSLRIYIR